MSIDNNPSVSVRVGSDAEKVIERINQTIAKPSIDEEIFRELKVGPGFTDKETYLKELEIRREEITRYHGNIGDAFYVALTETITKIDPWNYDNFILFLNSTYDALKIKYFPNDVVND